MQFSNLMLKNKYIVIGSGICGVESALALLEKGHLVEIWDIGIKEKKEFYLNSQNFLNTKKDFDNSYKMILGSNLQNFIEPSSKKIFNIPKSRNYFLSEEEINSIFSQLNNFNLTQSFANGGLSNGWGGNCLPYSSNDLSSWNINYSSFEESLSQVYDHIGVSDINDDINSLFNIKNYGSQKSIKTSKNDDYLMKKYNQNIDYFKNNFFSLGKARLAIKNNDKTKDCNLCGKCIWGCSREAIYNSTKTLFDKCLKYKSFQYFSDRHIQYFVIKDNIIKKIAYKNRENKICFAENDSTIILAAGAIQSGIIFQKTLYKNEIQFKIVSGLMDTKVLKLVYLIPKMIGSKFENQNVQFNRLISGTKIDNDYYHNEIYSEFLNLNSLFYQPLINSLPFPLKLSKKIFYSLFTALGVVTIFLPDKLNIQNNLKLSEDKEKSLIFYSENSQKVNFEKKVLKKISNFLIKLGTIPIKKILYEPGSGIHYAGTIPIGNQNYPLDNRGKVKFLKNLYVADSSAFPNLPSKPISLNAAAFSRYVIKNIDK